MLPATPDCSCEVKPRCNTLPLLLLLFGSTAAHAGETEASASATASEVASEGDSAGVRLLLQRLPFGWDRANGALFRHDSSSPGSTVCGRSGKVPGLVCADRARPRLVCGRRANGRGSSCQISSRASRPCDGTHRCLAVRLDPDGTEAVGGLNKLAAEHKSLARSATSRSQLRGRRGINSSSGASTYSVLGVDANVWLIWPSSSSQFCSSSSAKQLSRTCSESPSSISCSSMGIESGEKASCAGTT